MVAHTKIRTSRRAAIVVINAARRYADFPPLSPQDVEQMSSRELVRQLVAAGVAASVTRRRDEQYGLFASLDARGQDD